MIPSEGTVKVIRCTERFIRNVQPPLPNLQHMVRNEIALEDVFVLGEHIENTQFGIDNHHFMLLSLVVGCFYTLRMHHIAK